MTGSASPARDEPPAEASGLDRVAGRVATISAATAAVGIVLILAIICVEVVLRQFKSSLLVADEIAGYLNAAVVFLGLAYTLREGGFIRVELLYDQFKGRLKQLVRWIIVLVGTVYVGALLYYSVLHVIYAYKKDTRAISVIETPEWIPQSAAVVGFAVLLLQLLAYLADRVRRIP